MRNYLATAAMVAFSLLTGIGSAAAEDCKPSREFTTLKPGVLMISAQTYRPYSIVEPNGTISGIDGELLQEIARRECLTIESVIVDAAAALNYVQTGKADVTVGDWYRTKARSEVMNMTDPLYLDQMGIVSKDGVSKLSELEGKVVGTLQSNLWVPDLKKLYGANLRLYPVVANVQQDLKNGRIDAYVESYSIAIIASQSGEIEGYKAAVAEPDERVLSSTLPGQGAFPLNKDNTSLLEVMNANIAELHKNGFIEKLLVKYGLDASAAKTGEPRWME